MTLSEMIVAKRTMTDRGWLFCGGIMHDQGATGNFGLLYCKGDRRFYLNKNTINDLPID